MSQVSSSVTGPWRLRWHWGEALMDLKIFIVDSGADIQPVMKALTGSLEAIQEWVK